MNARLDLFYAPTKYARKRIPSHTSTSATKDLNSIYLHCVCMFEDRQKGTADILHFSPHFYTKLLVLA